MASTLSRRIVLGAAGATLLSGLAAAKTRRGRGLMHAAGLLRGADRQPAPADIALESGILRSGRRFVRTRGSGPVVLCLHGRAENERFAFDTLRVHEFARELQLELQLISVDGGSHSYWHARNSGGSPVAEVVNELLPREVPAFVIGWSMGGYGALLAALEHPGVFSGVITSSAAVWNTHAESARDAFDNAADFAAHDVWSRLDQLANLPVRIDCGEDDPFVTANRRLVAALPHAEGGISAGFHDSRFWRSVLREQLRFIAGARPCR